MKKKAVIFCLVLFLLAGSPVFAQNQLGDIRGALNDFTTSLALSLPFNSTLGLNWSDAYIRNFPRFGVGLSLGYTTMNAPSLWDLFGMFDLSRPAAIGNMGGYPLPGYTVEGRLGGFFLPFDMGFKIGYLSLRPSGVENLDYYLIGGDIRYAVLRQRGFIPAISVGIGVNYLSGGIGIRAGSDREFNYVDTNDTIQTLTLQRPTIALDWATTTLDFKAQASRSFALITPYLGLGVSHGWSRAGYSVSTGITDTGGNVGAANEVFRQLGIDRMNASGFSSSQSFGGWSVRTFGGLSINFTIIKLDFTVLYNFRDNNYGISIGSRFQF